MSLSLTVFSLFYLFNMVLEILKVIVVFIVRPVILAHNTHETKDYSTLKFKNL